MSETLCGQKRNLSKKNKRSSLWDLVFIRRLRRSFFVCRRTRVQQQHAQTSRAQNNQTTISYQPSIRYDDCKAGTATKTRWRSKTHVGTRRAIVTVALASSMKRSNRRRKNRSNNPCLPSKPRRNQGRRFLLFPSKKKKKKRRRIPEPSNRKKNNPRWSNCISASRRCRTTSSK